MAVVALFIGGTVLPMTAPYFGALSVWVAGTVICAILVPSALYLAWDQTGLSRPSNISAAIASFFLIVVVGCAGYVVISKQMQQQEQDEQNLAQLKKFYVQIDELLFRPIPKENSEADLQTYTNDAMKWA